MTKNYKEQPHDLEPLVSRPVISADWSDADKLKIVLAMTGLIREEINRGRYGLIGRMNIQSVHEVIIATPAELEPMRAKLQAIINEWYAEFCR